MPRLAFYFTLLFGVSVPFLIAGEPAPSARPLGDQFAKADPAADPSWSTEAFSERAGNALKELAELIDSGGEGDLPARFSDARSTSLRPVLESIHRGNGFEIFRPAAALDGSPSLPFGEEIRRALSPLVSEAGEGHHKFKIVRVERVGKGIHTRMRVEASRGGLQITAEWLATWEDADPASLPELREVRLLAYEEVRALSAPPFTENTAEVLGGVDSFDHQLAYGAEHWNGNLDVAFGMSQGNQGLAVGDADGDGMEDLYLCQPDGLPNLLYVRRADGSLEERAAEAGLDILDLSRSPLFVDLDNDGDEDLLLSHRSSVSVFRNDGGLRFHKVATHETASRMSGLAAADYDNDGDLDFLACGYSPTSQTSPEDIFSNPVPYYDALNGAFNYLFRNEGDLHFTDATPGSGFDVANTRYSFTAAWADFDGDGDMDVYIANDFGRNNLFQNALSQTGKPHFKDIATELGVEDIGAGMSVDWGDPDNDGRLDLYVANMWSSAGGRIAHQAQFKAGADEHTRELLQRHARGNSLFLQSDAGKFRDVSLEAGVEMGRWAWGSLFLDFDNDGWEDIYTTNGFMTAPDTGDL